MHLHNPQSAILSAIIFNALIIIALIPLALKGVAYRPVGAAALLRRNLLIYGVGGIIVPFVGIKLIDMAGHRHRPRLRSRTMLKQIRPAIVMIVVHDGHHRAAYPLAMTGHRQVLFPHQANGSLIEKDGKVIGSELIGQNFASDKYFHGRPSATTEPDPKDRPRPFRCPMPPTTRPGSNLGRRRRRWSIG
jgi:hypothetical protein